MEAFELEKGRRLPDSVEMGDMESMGANSRRCTRGSIMVSTVACCIVDGKDEVGKSERVKL